jgi:hypothetical protein
MLFSLVDYSAAYFSGIAKQRVPVKRSGKFVQIINIVFQKEYFVMSPKGLSVYHANIVERFCLENNIVGQYNAKKDFFRIRDSEWAVAGGGMFEINDKAKIIRVSGASVAYGSFCCDGLKDKLMSSDYLHQYEVIVGA